MQLTPHKVTTPCTQELVQKLLVWTGPVSSIMRDSLECSDFAQKSLVLKASQTQLPMTAAPT